MDHKRGPKQIALMLEEFNPMPHGAGQYVVAVQNRKGERDALSQVDEATWKRTTPLVLFVPHGEPAETMKASTVAGWTKNVEGVVGKRPCFVDVLRVKPTQQVEVAGGKETVLATIYRGCRQRGMQFVPVVHVGQESNAVLDVVAETAEEDERGVCLRYSVMEAISATGIASQQVFEETIKGLKVDVGNADVILDLGWLNPDLFVDTQAIASRIKEVCAVGAWRNVVLLGTSIPSTMGGIPQGTVGTLPRMEWRLWNDLRSVGVDRMPSFGDYGIQHPEPPSTKGGMLRANIRYTAADYTIVARGIGLVVQEGREQYHGLCQSLVARDEFSGRDYTWGDGVIADCAEGSLAPGSQNMWRGAGCSHHIRFVVDQIVNTQPAPQ